MQYLSSAEGAVTVLVAHWAGPGGSHHLILDDTIAIVETLLTPATTGENENFPPNQGSLTKCLLTTHT